MRSIWSGHIRFSLVTIPIQIFSAIESKNEIRFRQLHKKDHGPIGYSKVCKACDQEIPYADIIKGYEYEPDKYVVLDNSDFDNIRLKSNKAIDIEAFVNIDDVHPTRFEAVYFVGPKGEVAHQTFNLFAQTLKNSNKAGLGRLILREKEDVVLLTEHKGGLILYKLRYPYELRKISDIPGLTTTKVDETQLKLAETLVQSLSMRFEDIEFEDRYRDALLEMVEAKIAGKETVDIAEEIDDTPVV
ncbi:MAG: Ku protein, partial [Bacteroidia bacterium]|nr:Ku protein [Bacteroidia bacterium]